jgi:enoyl-CoA hydratase/carnithine racemase
MMDEGIPSLERAGHVATIRLRRPSQRNSLRDDDLHALLNMLARLDADDAVRVVVLTADTHGQRPVFCAGYHLTGFDGDAHDPRLFEQVPNALEALRPITVCALNGSVYGGATDLVLACDLCIAAHGLEWRMPATAIGLHYYPHGLRRYVSRLGLAHAKRALLCARSIPLEELASTGLFERMVPPQEFDVQLEALVAQVASLAPLAAQATKRSLNELGAGLFDESRLRERETQALISIDFSEGRSAVAQKRIPRFVGR